MSHRAPCRSTLGAARGWIRVRLTPDIEHASADPADLAGATNHRRLALAGLESGKWVSKAATRADGRSVEY